MKKFCFDKKLYPFKIFLGRQIFHVSNDKEMLMSAKIGKKAYVNF